MNRNKEHSFLVPHGTHDPGGIETRVAKRDWRWKWPRSTGRNRVSIRDEPIQNRSRVAYGTKLGNRLAVIGDNQRFSTADSFKDLARSLIEVPNGNPVHWNNVVHLFYIVQQSLVSRACRPHQRKCRRKGCRRRGRRAMCRVIREQAAAKCPLPPPPFPASPSHPV